MHHRQIIRGLSLEQFNMMLADVDRCVEDLSNPERAWLASIFVKCQFEFDYRDPRRRKCEELGDAITRTFPRGEVSTDDIVALIRNPPPDTHSIWRKLNEGHHKGG